jgi:hypothetical protein
LRRTCAAYAALGVGLVLLWQFLTIHYNYAGDWTAIYHTGAFTRVPPALEDEQIYRFPGSPGYDGQFYHFIAHDPLLLQDTASYVDNPRLRWRRILVPALAYIAALGQSDFVDSAYDAVMLAFVFLGAYWLGRFCGVPACGLLFALAPAVLVSIDRATVDVSLAALCIGFALYATKDASWKIYPVLALAPLARETGLCLTAALVSIELLRRRPRQALLAAATALPFAAWLIYLYAHTARDLTVFASLVPLEGLIARTLHPMQFAVTSRWLAIAAALDYLAVLGIWLALIFAFLRAASRPNPLQAAAMTSAAVAVFLAQPQAWTEAYSFGRTISPLLIFVGLLGISERRWWKLAPLALVIPRILWQLQPQWKGILHGIFKSS